MGTLEFRTNYENKDQVAAEDAGSKIGMRELEWRLQMALNDLPEQCRTVLQLSHFEGLKYRDIGKPGQELAP